VVFATPSGHIADEMIDALEPSLDQSILGDTRADTGLAVHDDVTILMWLEFIQVDGHTTMGHVQGAGDVAGTILSCRPHIEDHTIRPAETLQQLRGRHFGTARPHPISEDHPTNE
jgi:hypothetical protein